MDLMNDLSPLGQKLQLLIDQGVVNQMPIPMRTDFPSARITVPVYDATDTSAAPLPKQQGSFEWQTGATSSKS